MRSHRHKHTHTHTGHWALGRESIKGGWAHCSEALKKKNRWIYFYFFIVARALNEAPVRGFLQFMYRKSHQRKFVTDKKRSNVIFFFVFILCSIKSIILFYWYLFYVYCNFFITLNCTTSFECLWHFCKFKCLFVHCWNLLL